MNEDEKITKLLNDLEHFTKLNDKNLLSKALRKFDQNGKNQKLLVNYLMKLMDCQYGQAY